MVEKEITIKFLRNVLYASDISGKRGKLDIFCDRLIRVASESTLNEAIESLLRLVNVDVVKLHPPLASSMMVIALSEKGGSILRWIRKQPKLITMLVVTHDEAIVTEALERMELPEQMSDGSAFLRRGSKIGIDIICESPLAHGSDQKAGNATLFRRIQVIATNGSILHLPYYSGNAIRGQIRDLFADHLVAFFDLREGSRKIALWFFYALYSGGALEEKSDVMKALKKELGDHGAIRGEGIRKFRDQLPALSLLGCALGNRILPGRVQFADLRPICKEWGQGDKSIAEMLTWEWLTRREDNEEHEEHHGMIASTEVLRSGTRLEGGIDHDSVIAPMELAALGKGLELFKERGMIGAENRRGLGRVNVIISNIPDSSLYDTWLEENRDSIYSYLNNIGAII